MLNTFEGVDRVIYYSSIVFVFILVAIFPNKAFAAQTYASIDVQHIRDNTDIMMPHVRISISAEDTPINAAEVVLGYESDALTIDHIDGDTSDFHVAVPTETDAGEVHIVRGNTAALAQGKYNFIDIYFARTKKRRAYINLLPASVVTASDGQGTNVFDGQLPKLLI